MNDSTMLLLRALINPAKATELGVMGHEGVFSKIETLKSAGLISGAPGYGLGRGYVYSLPPAGRRLVAEGGTITPPPTYVPQGLYAPQAWQVFRPGAVDAMGVKSAGWPT